MEPRAVVGGPQGNGGIRSWKVRETLLGDKEMVFPVSMKGICLRVENSVLQIKGSPLYLRGCDMAS